MTQPVPAAARSLDQQREEYARRRFLAMPLAGFIAWVVAGAAGACLAPIYAVWTLFIATGCIAYLGMLLSRFTGEHFLDAGTGNPLAEVAARLIPCSLRPASRPR